MMGHPVEIKRITTHAWALEKKPTLRELFRKLEPGKDYAVRYIVDSTGQLHVASMSHEMLEKRAGGMLHAGSFERLRGDKIRHVKASMRGGVIDHDVAKQVEDILGKALSREGHPVQFETSEERDQAVRKARYSAKPGAWAEAYYGKPSPGG